MNTTTELDLFFRNPPQGEGIMTTVLRGREWYDLLTRSNRPVLRIKEENTDKVLAKARIVDIKYITFNDIPKDWVELFYSPENQTMEKLIRVMNTDYPGFGIHEKVTVVFFQPIK